MLQELAARTGATVWAIVSMLCFLVAWLAIAVWVYRTRPEDLEARAHLALEGEGDQGHPIAGADGTLRRGNHA
jgi:hypothetical protein